MHPAFSVIFFTASSGAGYGLLFLMGTLSVAGALPPDFWLGLVGLGLALGAISFGLLSSTFHLGHPERAWRALTQWRSSWLSREGVLAVLAYPPALVFAFGWVVMGDNYGPWALAGLAAAALSAATVFATGMIYASLKPIHQWHNIWTVPGYLMLGLMTGGVWLNMLVQLFDAANPYVTGAVLAGIAAGAIVKLGYWHFILNSESNSTPETATGLRVYGRVRMVESPHYVDNYLLREMGFQVARRHADRLRGVAVLLGFVVPFVLTLVTLAIPASIGAAVAGILAAISVVVGVVFERWLFFAEAKHSVTLYYGAEAA